ncbi:PPE domain-containing protein [Mycobacterium pseudoshottsii]|uniref:PPE domain-containing protein n=1 Tax=Mycobacterium pseudoshottsii TaxID=265949 RepID=UPI0021C43D84|nr:PPE domain-containing protein [Mycobacterium pseudoshottsii]
MHNSPAHKPANQQRRSPGAGTGSFSRFREFEDWDGDAAETVQDALLQHWDWLSSMAELSIKIAKQASDLAQVQHSAVQKHPTLHDVVALKEKSASRTTRPSTTSLVPRWRLC